MEERREEGEEEVMEAASQNSLAEHIARMEIRLLSIIYVKSRRIRKWPQFYFGSYLFFRTNIFLRCSQILTSSIYHTIVGSCTIMH